MWEKDPQEKQEAVQINHVHTLNYSPQYNGTKKNKMQPLLGCENRHTNTEQSGPRGINDCVKNGEGIQEIDQEQQGLDQGLKSTWAR